MLSQACNIVIERGVSAQVHGRVVFDGLNTTTKGLFHLIQTVKLPGSKEYDIHMENALYNL